MNRSLPETADLPDIRILQSRTNFACFEPAMTKRVLTAVAKTTSVMQLKPKNRTFRSVFENTGTGTVIIEADMTVTMVNASFETLTGYSREEIEELKKVTDFVHPEDMGRLEAYHIGRRNGHPVPGEYECRLMTRTGTVKHAAVRARVIPGTRRSVVSFMDITPRIASALALEKSRQQLANLVGNLPGMAYRRQGQAPYDMVYASDGCRALTGYSAARIVSGNPPTYRDLVNPDDQGQITALVHDALESKTRFQLTYRIRTPAEKEKWVWEQGIGIYGKDGDLAAIEGFVTDFTEHKEIEETYRVRGEQLQDEIVRLRSSISRCGGFSGLVGKTRAMQGVYELIVKAAAVDANVVVCGETGTGKELVARAIHDLSRRRGREFIAVNCGAIPETIIESEFFGYKKGAFTGAGRDKTGFLDLSDRGTLFLDELEEMSLNLQVKMLRAIDGHGFIPLGGSRVRLPDIRIIAATNKSPRDLVRTGRMREDFYFRINIIPVYIPPLRERKADIPRLVGHFMRKFSDAPNTALPDAVMEKFMAYDWPGNVRELQNAVHRYVSVQHVDFMATAADSKTTGKVRPAAGSRPLRRAVQEFEKQYIVSLLDQHRWCRTEVARILEIDRRTLHRKLKEYGITGSG